MRWGPWSCTKAEFFDGEEYSRTISESDQTKRVLCFRHEQAYRKVGAGAPGQEKIVTVVRDVEPNAERRRLQVKDEVEMKVNEGCVIG